MNLIVGIDPGTTTGIAVVDLRGNVLKVISSKDVGVSKAVELISDIGKPVIVATDKSKVPSFVEKVAARFRAKLVSPKRDMVGAEKKRLGGGFRGHERDALAAALYAYSTYETMFGKVEKSIPPKKWDSVKRKLVLEEAINRIDALRDAVKKKTTEKKQKERKSQVEKELADLKAENRALMEEIKLLKVTRTNVVKHITDQSISRLAEARLDTINTIRKEMKGLRKEMELLDNENKIFRLGGVPVGEDVTDMPVKEMYGIKYVSREDSKKLEKEKTQSLLKKIIKSHKSKTS